MGQIFVNGTQYAGILSNASNIHYNGVLSATTVDAALNELANKKVQSNWAEADSTQETYILNKPAIKSGSRRGSVMIGNNYADDGTNLLVIGAGASTAANIATIDTSGNAWFKGNAYVLGSNKTDAQQLITAASVASQYIAKTGADDLTGSLIPISPSTYNLGSSVQTWGNIYSDVLNSIRVNSETGYINELTSITSVTTPLVNLDNKAQITYDSTNERIVFSFS